MQRAIVDAAENGGESLETLQTTLGLSLGELVKMDAVHQFEAIGSAIAKMPEPAKRTAVAMELFSRTGYTLAGAFRNMAEVKQAFANPTAFDQAMSRSAEMFERIDIDLEKTKGKATQLFTGMADMILPQF